MCPYDQNLRRNKKSGRLADCDRSTSMKFFCIPIPILKVETRSQCLSFICLSYYSISGRLHSHLIIYFVFWEKINCLAIHSVYVLFYAEMQFNFLSFFNSIHVLFIYFFFLLYHNVGRNIVMLILITKNEHRLKYIQSYKNETNKI